MGSWQSMGSEWIENQFNLTPLIFENQFNLTPLIFEVRLARFFELAALLTVV